MTDPSTNEYAPDRVSPPGETLAETLEALGMSQVELATRLGRPRKTVNEIIKGKAAIEPATALQLEAVLGVPAVFWMEREARYRESVARHSRTQAMAESADWAQRFPFAAMARLGWVPEDTPRRDRVAVLLRYFGVASPEAWASVWKRLDVAFRRSVRRECNEAALAAWLRRGEVDAQAIDCAPYSGDRFRAVLTQARSLTREEPAVFQVRLMELFASGGVALVWVPELVGAPVSGATRWLSDQKALIQVSLRYKSDDQLFFSILHEAAHVLLHSKKAVFLETAGQDTPEEQEANRFAADLLIPPAAYGRLLTGPLSLAAVERFAETIGVAPGVVVGRLQHEGHLQFRQANHLKRRLEWA